MPTELSRMACEVPSNRSCTTIHPSTLIGLLTRWRLQNSLPLVGQLILFSFQALSATKIHKHNLERPFLEAMK